MQSDVVGIGFPQNRGLIISCSSRYECHGSVMYEASALELSHFVDGLRIKLILPPNWHILIYCQESYDICETLRSYDLAKM